ncbi:MAG: hypothetical protein R6W73_03615 [Candidatus Saliniplasma sp.]
MHPAIHVGLSIIIGLGMGFHFKRKYVVIILGALGVNGLLDLDYIFKGYGLMELRYFHTGIGMLYLPILILIGVHIYERNRDTSIITRMSIFVLIVALGHLVLDTFSGDTPVMLYYPLSIQEYTFDPRLLPIALIFFIGITAASNVLETYLYNNNEGIESLPEKEPGKDLIHSYRKRMTHIKETIDETN